MKHNIHYQNRPVRKSTDFWASIVTAHVKRVLIDQAILGSRQRDGRSRMGVNLSVENHHLKNEVPQKVREGEPPASEPTPLQKFSQTLHGERALPAPDAARAEKTEPPQKLFLDKLSEISLNSSIGASDKRAQMALAKLFNPSGFNQGESKPADDEGLSMDCIYTKKT